jgi:hypothetical protein
MLYIKNVPNWERGIRILLSLVVGILGYQHFGFSTVGILIMVSAMGFSITGFVGWCPMCALVGRKLEMEKRLRGQV